MIVLQFAAVLRTLEIFVLSVDIVIEYTYGHFNPHNHKTTANPRPSGPQRLTVGRGRNRRIKPLMNADGHGLSAMKMNHGTHRIHGMKDGKISEVPQPHSVHSVYSVVKNPKANKTRH